MLKNIILYIYIVSGYGEGEGPLVVVVPYPDYVVRKLYYV